MDLERRILPEPARQVTPPKETFAADNSSRQQAQDHTHHASAPLEHALRDVNNNLKAWSTGIRFDIDQDAQRVVVSIIDNDTGEVLRTVPSDAVIKIAKMIVQLQGQGVRTSA